jgi:hypothetical protein
VHHLGPARGALAGAERDPARRRDLHYVPGRGDGANVALKDAQMLVRALPRVASGTASLASATGGYQAEMLQHGFQAVADSRR